MTQLDLQQLRASIDSVCYDIPELDTRLYSVPTVVLSEVSQDKKGREHYRPVDTYCYFLQVDDSSLCSDFLGMTEDAAADQKMIILGKRASQGLNLFSVYGNNRTEKFRGRSGILPEYGNAAA